MDFFSAPSKALFPLQTIADLERLFELEVIAKEEPNLALLSILLGAIEGSLVELDYPKALLLPNTTNGKRRKGATAPTTTTTTNGTSLGQEGGGGGGVTRKSAGKKSTSLNFILIRELELILNLFYI